MADQIHESFENDNYTLGVFIGLSNEFDTIDHAVLLEKLENYGIKDTNLTWFRSYLTNRKQYIQITNVSKSDLRNTTCGVPQGSILRPLLFLVYVNDLPSSSKILNRIMFADDTNHFHEYKNIIKIFATVNEELMNINEWLMANKLSLNVGKTKYSLFHKPNRVDDLPLKRPKLSINIQEIKRASYTKFLGVLLDESLSWKEHLKYTEKKIAKSIRLMYKAKLFLDRDSLLPLYLSNIHSYINHANLAWASTHKTNLEKIQSQQKHDLRIVYNKDRYYLTKECFRSCNVLNVYKLNLLNTSIFIHKIKTGTGPAAFHTTFRMPSHSYPTHFSSVNYSKPKTRLCKSRFRISIRGPATWNNFFSNIEKELKSSSLFKSKVKTKLFDFEYEVTFV